MPWTRGCCSRHSGWVHGGSGTHGFHKTLRSTRISTSLLSWDEPGTSYRNMKEIGESSRS